MLSGRLTRLCFHFIHLKFFERHAHHQMSRMPSRKQAQPFSVDSMGAVSCLLPIRLPKDDTPPRIDEMGTSAVLSVCGAIFVPQVRRHFSSL